MALSGSFKSNTGTALNLRVDWTATQSVTGNTSTITEQVYLEYLQLAVGARADSTVTIDGVTETYNVPAINDYTSGSKSKLLKTYTRTVSHDGNGNKTANIAASWRFQGTYSGVNIGTITVSQNVTLNQIDRVAPSVALSTSTPTVNSVGINVSASTTCDIWQYSTDGGSTWTTFHSSAGTSKSFTITGLAANTTYTIKARARKQTNQVFGVSGAVAVKTLGATALNSVSAVTADAATVNITFNRTIYNTAFSHTLEIKNGSSSILTISGIKGSAGTANQTITLTAAQRTTLLTAMSRLQKFTGTFILTTYNGSSAIGTATQKTAIVQTTQANSGPVFSNAAGFTYLDSNTITTAITGNNQILIKNYSALKITAYSATAKNGATITGFEATVDKITVSSATTALNVGTIPTAGAITITVSAIDSRGYRATVSKAVTVVDYENISIENYVMRRINEIEDMTEFSINGKISKISADGVNKNSFQALKYRYKKTSDSAYSAWVTVIPQATETAFTYKNIEFRSFDAEYSWDINISAQDKLSSATIDIILPQGTPLIGVRKKQIGINKEPLNGALDVNGDIYMNGKKVSTESVSVVSANLLDNWHFGHPVNQRGKTVYTTSENRIYTIDRWFISGPHGKTWTARVVEGGLQLGVGTPFSQRFETVGWDGKTVTFSIIVNGQTYSYTFIWDSGLRYGAGPVFPNGWQLSYNGTGQYTTLQNVSGAATDVLSAVKLELGETSTLQNSPPPNFAQELLKCQRYYYVVRTEDESVPYHPQTLYATDTAGEMLVLAQPKVTMRHAHTAGSNSSLVPVYLNGVGRGGKVTLRDSIDGSTATGTFAQFNNNAPGMMVPFRLEGATTHAGHIYEATIEWIADF